MITVHNLSKSYGTTEAVQNLSFDLQSGEILGFLGPNGSGKTTTLKIVMGLTQSDTGEVYFALDDTHHDVRQYIGYLPEDTFVYDKLTGREFLQFIGRMQDVPELLLQSRIEDLLRMFEMTMVSNQLIESYSKGMKRKIALCAALIHQPDILILDEPTDGLDVIAIRVLKDLLIRLRNSGKSIVFSTHILAIAEEICDRFVIIHKGREICTGTIEDLRERTCLYRASLEDIFVYFTKTCHNHRGKDEKIKNAHSLLGTGGA